MFPRQKQFKFVYDIGIEKLDKDFDLFKLIKDMKYLKMLTRYKLKPDDYLKVQIAHSLKNMIDLDKVIEKEWI